MSSIYKASLFKSQYKGRGKQDTDKQTYKALRRVSISYNHKKYQLGWLRFAEKRQRGSYLPRCILDALLAHTLHLLSQEISLALLSDISASHTIPSSPLLVLDPTSSSLLSQNNKTLASHLASVLASSFRLDLNKPYLVPSKACKFPHCVQDRKQSIAYRYLPF